MQPKDITFLRKYHLLSTTFNAQVSIRVELAHVKKSLHCGEAGRTGWLPRAEKCAQPLKANTATMMTPERMDDVQLPYYHNS